MESQPSPLTSFAVVDNPVKGNAQRCRDYRQRKRQSVTDKLRPFLAWDGEGINEADGSHTYVVLANSVGGRISGRQGLATAEIFQFIIDTKVHNRDAIHVIYGGSYDFNMWLKDLPREDVEALYTSGKVKWHGYILSWRPGKCFTITALRRKGFITVTIYDVVSFFQCSFVNACDSYLGDGWHERERIVREKSRRGNFSYDELTAISEYNDAELVNLVALMDNLRERLVKVDLMPSRWDGPGAIAAKLMSKEGVKNALPDRAYDAPLAAAIRSAYSGGRFETFRYGFSRGRVWEYDINSAYPSAMLYLPNLRKGVWRQATKASEDLSRRSFTVYRLRFSADSKYSRTNAGPLWARRKDGTIFYPRKVVGWYWQPEAAAAQRFVDKHGGKLEVLDSWTFIEETSDKPFSFVLSYYLKRQALKRGCDGAERAIKLGLNSLYGKLAQQVGWSVGDDGSLKLPPFHCLEWAGYITSFCRAKLLDAITQNPDAIIATETDALFSTVPLELPLSNNLGDWEEVLFDSITYIQSGVYYGSNSGKVTAKSRGLDREQNDVRLVQAALNAGQTEITTSVTRFVGAGMARMGQWEKWRRWITSERTMQLYPMGKRASVAVLAEAAPSYDRLNDTTVIAPSGYVESYEYPVAWVDSAKASDSEMLEELRHEPTEWEQ